MDDFFHQSNALNDVIINIILVKIGARRACLLESADFKKTEWASLYPRIQVLIHDLGLREMHDPMSLQDYPRIFVSQKKNIQSQER